MKDDNVSNSRVVYEDKTNTTKVPQVFDSFGGAVTALPSQTVKVAHVERTTSNSNDKASVAVSDLEDLNKKVTGLEFELEKSLKALKLSREDNKKLTTNVSTLNAKVRNLRSVGK